MNIVYRLTFTKRKKNNIMPYLYIGSKSNAVFKEGVILDKKGRPYYGSSCFPNYSDIVKDDDVEVEILKEFESYTDALNYESTIQKSLDVVADTRYFNLSIATINYFSFPNYATVRNIHTGKVVRLPVDHPSIISGEYVGVTKNCSLTEEQKKKIGRKGKENHFYGKKHTKETKEKISSKNQGREISEERRKLFIENVAKKDKTEEHRKKIGRKNLIMLKNKETLETIRIPTEEKYKYDPGLWVNPYILSDNKSTGSRWINDGEQNKKLKANESLPDGWFYGRLYKGWNENKSK